MTDNNQKLNEQLKKLQSMFKEQTFEFQKYHWLITGKEFFTLHEWFEDLYNWSFKQEDVFAEKLLKKEELPIIDQDVISKLSKLKRIEKETSNEEIFKKMSNNLILFKEELIILEELADEVDEITTEDLAVSLLEEIETIEWKLKTFLK